MSERFIWTPDRIETLRVMAARNQSAAEIGAELGITRNAVCGKAMRERITLNGRDGHGPKTYAPRAPRALAAPSETAPPPEPEIVITPDAERTDGVPFLDRESGQCAWIIRPGFCCGLVPDAAATQPYCRHHRKIGTQGQPAGIRMAKSSAPPRKVGRWSGRG